MRFGIRAKLILSLTFTLLLPIFTVMFVGGGIQANMRDIVLLIAALSIPFGICIAAIAGLVSRSLLTPLQELHIATGKVKAGDLDFTIRYRRNNEIGDLCAAFESMKEQLKSSLAKQAALEQARKELIASISHDLRTPLTSIKGYVEGLQDGIVKDEEQLRRYVTIIKNKTENLDQLIERLFQFAQLDMADPQDEMLICDSKALLEAIISPLEVEFADQSVKLEAARPFPSVPLRANETSLAQVFHNLIDNARRYAGDQGTITVKASVEQACLRITVSDNGPGIPSQHLPHIFDHFYRAEKSRSRTYGGSGLGLAICKQIIEQHGGQIWAESVPHKQTDFHCVLPIQRTEAASHDE